MTSPQLPAAAYCYVLGLYLGDGCISRNRRVWRLRITLDAKYPAIIDRCRQAIDILMPRQRAGISAARMGASKCGCTPSTGHACSRSTVPARSTSGAIRLEPWQQALVDQATEEFIIGPDPQRRLPRRRQRPRRHERPLSLLEHVRGHPSDCSPPHSTLSTFRGLGRARTSSPSTAKPRPPASTTFVGPKDRAVPLNGVHYTA